MPNTASGNNGPSTAHCSSERSPLPTPRSSRHARGETRTPVLKHALDALAVAGVRQTVVTGNVRPVAEIKLGVFGLDTHIEWDAGAYGEDADLRPALVDFALTRSSTAAGDAVLIGDTPADVEGGRENGVHVIAVATGRSSATELLGAGAHHVLDDLSDIERLLTLIASRA
ncbi:HAD family hydrolase [Streptomyces sp. NPDC057137]|uniref:HAD family hydrolase n=1 Tax=Streptomyces sp. NPDC057137 TaxID=3346030 RepID=UPI003637DDF5